MGRICFYFVPKKCGTGIGVYLTYVEKTSAQKTHLTSAGECFSADKNKSIYHYVSNVINIRERTPIPCVLLLISSVCCGEMW